MGETKAQKPKINFETSAVAAAAAALNPVAAKVWIDFVSESARFMTGRLQKDVDLQARLLACQGPAELLDLQKEFFSTALEDYADETIRYFKMVTDAAQAIAEDVEGGHRRNYDDIPL